VTVTGLSWNLERALDLTGVLVFALSGASLGARKRFDVIGILTLAAATGLGGGMLRDTLLGEHPPAAMRDQVYLWMPLVATVVVVAGHRAVERMARPVLVFDALGLGLFAVVGAGKALDNDVGVLAAVLLGVMTAVGGGIVRDVLARDVPYVFRPDSALYAIPATLGAVATTAAWTTGRFDATAAIAIALLVSSVRLLAMRFDWRAPMARGSG
jgi:uncharacterized membrane protein YeiH